VDIGDVEGHALWQREQLQSLLGRVTVASEGVNGTLSGSAEALDIYEARLRLKLNVEDMEFHRSASEEQRVFPDLKVVVSRELVGNGEVVARALRGASAHRGTHLSPAAFKEKLERGDSLVLDVRNGFEFDVGRFEGAVKAPIRTMSEWGAWVERSGIVDVAKRENKEILTYCTGGVRCEKATQFLLALGAPKVSQLKGGICSYLDAYPDSDNFKGRNFLFDAREAKSSTKNPVGKCSDCNKPWDTHSGRNLCSVCETLTLVCDDCRRTNHDHYCDIHTYLRETYCYFLDVYTDDQLQQQEINLHNLFRKQTSYGRRKKSRNQRRTEPLAQPLQQDSLPSDEETRLPTSSANVRRALRKQLERLRQRRRENKETTSPSIYRGPPRCRSCGLADCQGFCWGFWAACGGAENTTAPLGEEASTSNLSQTDVRSSKIESD